MKAKSLILALCGAFVSLTASAQFANTTGGSNSTTTSSNEGWSKFYVNYNPASFDVNGADFDLSTGFSAGYTKAKNLSSSLPLYWEAGLGLHYATGTEETGDIEDKITSFSAYIPVNLIYKFTASEKFAIAPYAGLNARFNIIGKEEVEGYGESYDVNLFDDDDVEDTANRFQLGYQIGVNAIINDKFSIGLEYQGFFTEYMKKVDVSAWSVGVGFIF